MDATQIQLARTAVVAKAAYWDKLRAFENATASNGDWPDRVNNKVLDVVDALAVGVEIESSGSEALTDEDIVESFTLALAGA